MAVNSAHTFQSGEGHGNTLGLLLKEVLAPASSPGVMALPRGMYQVYNNLNRNVSKQDALPICCCYGTC